ncbi:hypothetical protein ABT234_15765 [Streptomyces sp. NPDC001586]|uniref:hypothetical protein n=1 Tax=Streptomyces sp. NPDC001586 TaxID=3154387 RepID=UPI00332A8973
MTTHEGIPDTKPVFDVVQHAFDPTANSTEPDSWAQAVAAAPASVLDGGGANNTAIVNRMVQIARGQIGVAESPSGSNGGLPLTRYVRYFNPNLGPSRWCAFFVSWAWDQASDKNHRVPWGNPGHVGSVYDWAGKVGRLVSSPIHGDLFGVGNSHIGVVAGSNPQKRSILTVEGNYGDKVAGVSRPWAGLWFARLA